MGYTISVEDFYKFYLFMESRIIPNLGLAEGAIYRFAFLKALIYENLNISLSIREILQYVPVSPKTASRAIKDLIKRQCLKVYKPPLPHRAGIYTLCFPDLSKNGKMFPVDIALPKPQPELIINILTPEDESLLNSITETLPPDRYAQYKNESLIFAQKHNIDPETAFKEIVIRNEFGPMRLKKYGNR
jgi:hypothetical protein